MCCCVLRGMYITTRLHWNVSLLYEWFLPKCLIYSHCSCKHYLHCYFSCFALFKWAHPAVHTIFHDSFSFIYEGPALHDCWKYFHFMECCILQQCCPLSWGFSFSNDTLSCNRSYEKSGRWSTCGAFWRDVKWRSVGPKHFGVFYLRTSLYVLCPSAGGVLVCFLKSYHSHTDTQ